MFVLVCVLLSLFAFVDARRGRARRRARAARGLDAVGGGASRERPRRTRRPSRPFVRPSVMRAPPPPPPPRHHLDAVDLVRDARDAFTDLAPDLPGAVLYLDRGAGRGRAPRLRPRAPPEPRRGERSAAAARDARRRRCVRRRRRRVHRRARRVRPPRADRHRGAPDRPARARRDRHDDAPPAREEGHRARPPSASTRRRRERRCTAR